MISTRSLWVGMLISMINIESLSYWCGLHAGGLAGLVGSGTSRGYSSVGCSIPGMVKLMFNVFWRCDACLAASTGKMWYHSVRMEKDVELGSCDCAPANGSASALVRCGLHGDDTFGLAHHVGDSIDVVNSGLAMSIARGVVASSGGSVTVVDGIIPCSVLGSHHVSTNLALGPMNSKCNCQGRMVDLPAVRMCAHKMEDCCSSVCSTCCIPFIGGELIGTKVWEKANMSSRPGSGSVRWG